MNLYDSDADTRTKQIAKAQAFASKVSRKLGQNFSLLKSGSSMSLQGIRVKGILAPRTQLPQARVWLDFNELDMDLRGRIAVELRKHYYVESMGDSWIVVSPVHVSVIPVPSSDGEGTYRVRLENSVPVMCNCFGFMYRLTCRHLAESVKLNHEKIPV